MLIVSVRVFSKNTDFDIFVRYDPVNLSDYRHFSRFRRIMRVDGIWVYIGNAVGMKIYQSAQRRVSGHTGVSVGTRTCQWVQGRKLVLAAGEKNFHFFQSRGGVLLVWGGVILPNPPPSEGSNCWKQVFEGGGLINNSLVVIFGFRKLTEANA